MKRGRCTFASLTIEFSSKTHGENNGGVAGVSPAERVAEATAGEAEEAGAQGEIRFANEFCILLYE